MSSMVNTKKKNVHVPLVITGYILFVLFVIAVILSIIIPFGKMLLDPRVLHFNVALFTVALTIGSLLPVVLGYLVGDRSVKSKSRLSHHFNGILFGLLAYWVMMLLTSLVAVSTNLMKVPFNTNLIVVNTLPTIGVVVILAILSIAHVRSRQSRLDLIEFKPYFVVLVISIILMQLWSLLGNGMYGGAIEFSSFLPCIATIVLWIVSYITLRKTRLSSSQKNAWSAVSVSVLSASIFVVFQLTLGMSYYIEPTPSMEFQSALNWVAWIIGLLGWVIYWRMQTKRLAR